MFVTFCSVCWFVCSGWPRVVAGGQHEHMLEVPATRLLHKAGRMLSAVRVCEK